MHRHVTKPLELRETLLYWLPYSCYCLYLLLFSPQTHVKMLYVMCSTFPFENDFGPAPMGTHCIKEKVSPSILPIELTTKDSALRGHTGLVASSPRLLKVSFLMANFKTTSASICRAEETKDWRAVFRIYMTKHRAKLFCIKSFKFNIPSVTRLEQRSII